MRTILLVCTGNTCRSPMAEAMLKDMAARAGKHVEVRSAGVGAIDGYPVSPHAAQTLRRRNLPVPGPSQALSAQQIAWADVILAMTSSHKRTIIQRHPDAAGKTYTLKELAYRGDMLMDEVAEAERLYTEWQIRQSMGQDLEEADRLRLMELQHKIPDFDIADPFGGPLAAYEQSANEISEALQRIVDKLGAPGPRESD
jgi:protein-tyrosine-phosphatase